MPINVLLTTHFTECVKILIHTKIGTQLHSPDNALKMFQSSRQNDCDNRFFIRKKSSPFQIKKNYHKQPNNRRTLKIPNDKTN